jgi:ribosomal protein S18 acetylase RimI-like enzyme
MCDPMGGTAPLPQSKAEAVMESLQRHPTAFVLFAAVDMNIVGMAVCFENYSTFLAAPFINIHDLAVLPEYRGRGIGKVLLQQVILDGIHRRCAKVTLEVRGDNIVARALYARTGFHSDEPATEYLTMNLSSHLRYLHAL